MIRRTLLIGWVAFAFVGCNQPHVRTQTTPGADFSKYHTYAIRPGNVAYPGASEAQRAEIVGRLQDAIAMRLEQRGLTPQPEDPDLIVTYTAGAQQRDPAAAVVRAPVGVDVRGSSGGGYDEPGAVRAREWPDAAADIESRRRYTEGNLVVDLLDGKNRRLIWRATANLEVASDHGARMIDRVVGEALEPLPLGKTLATTRRAPATLPAPGAVAN